MPDFAIAADDAARADIRELALAHRSWAGEHSPPEDVHAVEADALLHPTVTLLTARTPTGTLLGMGALRELDAGHAELKAMHVRAPARGQGVGSALLDALVGLARQRSYRRVSLETGTMDAFGSARSLYASVGFRPCPPFGSYVQSPHSVCMTLVLDPAPASA